MEATAIYSSEFDQVDCERTARDLALATQVISAFILRASVSRTFKEGTL